MKFYEIETKSFFFDEKCSYNVEKGGFFFTFWRTRKEIIRKVHIFHGNTAG